MLLNEIINQAELDLLALFNIELKHNRLIKDSHKECIFHEINSDGEYVFKCDDLVIKIRVQRDSNDEIIPLGITVEENNLTYYASSGEGRELSINKRREHINKITIKPNIDMNFITTTFNYPNYDYSFPREMKIMCSFNKIYLYPYIGWHYEDFDFEGYQSLFSNLTLELYDKDIKDAYLRCASYFYRGFEEYLKYPKEHYDEFVKYFESERIKSTNSFVKKIEQAIREKKIFDEVTTEAYKTMDDEIDTLGNAERDFNSFVESLSNGKEYTLE